MKVLAGGHQIDLLTGGGIFNMHSSIWHTLLFWIFSVGLLSSAITAVSAKKPIHSAVGLLVSSLFLAGIYFLLSSPFIAAMQIIIYSGAVLVLFVIAIMLTGGIENHKRITKSRIIGALAGIVIALIVVVIILLNVVSFKNVKLQNLAPDFGTASGVGTILFQRHMFAFELTSALFLVALFGSILIAKRRLR